MRLYCLYDRLAEEAGPIFEAKNEKVAVRMIQPHIKSVKTEEFRLMFLGEYDHEIPYIRSCDPREVIGINQFVEDEGGNE